jgi:YidC/Oxa1 family membrane protein insertase
MPDESKRLLIAVFLCLGILFVWQTFFAPPPPPPTGGSGKPAKTESGTAAPAAGAPARPAAPAGPETRLTLRAPRVQAEISSRGGGLASYRLLGRNFREERSDKEIQVDLVQSQDLLPLQIGLEGPLAIDTGQPWRLSQDGEFGFVMVQESAQSRFTKRLRFAPKSWVADLTVNIENLTKLQQPARLTLHVHGRQRPDAPKAGMMTPGVRVWRAACHANGEVDRRDHESLVKEEISHVGDILWGGIEDKYFLLAAIPVDEKQSLRCALSARDDGGLDTAISYAERRIAPGGSEQYSFRLYLGPKTLEDLDAVTAGGRDARLGEAVNYGWLEKICRPMIWLLKWAYRGTGNWGIAIVLLTIIVKLLTLYPTHKSMLSMRRMAQVGPEMQKLRDKFKNDKDRLNQEVMALYRRHNINPLGGCLPMLLQMPIWIALYTTISESVELYREPFTYLRDLAAADPYFILPIVLAGLTFAQTKLSPTPSQDPQAKMMSYMMPAMFLFFSLFVPSGLTLYWLVNTLLGMVHQLYLNRRHPLAKAGA